MSFNHFLVLSACICLSLDLDLGLGLGLGLGIGMRNVRITANRITAKFSL